MHESWILWAMKGTKAQLTYIHCYKKHNVWHNMYINLHEAAFSHLIVLSNLNANIYIYIYIHMHTSIGMQTWQEFRFQKWRPPMFIQSFVRCLSHSFTQTFTRSFFPCSLWFYKLRKLKMHVVLHVAGFPFCSSSSSAFAQGGLAQGGCAQPVCHVHASSNTAQQFRLHGTSVFKYCAQPYHTDCATQPPPTHVFKYCAHTSFNSRIQTLWTKSNIVTNTRYRFKPLASPSAKPPSAHLPPPLCPIHAASPSPPCRAPWQAPLKALPKMSPATQSWLRSRMQMWGPRRRRDLYRQSDVVAEILVHYEDQKPHIPYFCGDSHRTYTPAELDIFDHL